MSEHAKEGAFITAETAVSEVMKARYYHGDGWQDYISDRFEGVGIKPTFKTIYDGIANRRADYQYNGFWIEAKTHIGDSDVTKIEKIYNILSKMNIKMIVMAEWEQNSKKYARNVKNLRKIGVIVFEGISECESFIINESIRLQTNTEIKMSVPMLIPFEDLVPHPDNRDLNLKNVNLIKASVDVNGFITQINVVPHIMGPNGRMLYMVFEGHTRYEALRQLADKGRKIPDVACVCVPWISSKNIKELHEMLIVTNTTYKAWLIKNFVKSHNGVLQKIGDLDGIFTYGKILQSMNQAKKQKWGEATPVYLFSHYDSLSFDDINKIKNGTYRISKEDYENQILPILNLMNSITSNKRKYSGNIIRDIIVDIRVMYNTDDIVKINFSKFMEWLDKKIIGVYDSGEFPITKETGQRFWNAVKRDWYNLVKMGLVPQSEKAKPKTIMSFVNS